MGNRLSKIYTRTGDSGTTGLGDGTRVAKDSARVTAYGTIDEANCAIGLVLASAPEQVPDDIRELLTTVQHQLFDLGGELCIPGHAAIFDADIDALERALDAHNAELPPLKEFILPGGGEAAARCHLARTIVRRAERATVTLAHHDPVRPQAIGYLNRLSDLLFVLARVLETNPVQRILLDPDTVLSPGSAEAALRAAGAAVAAVDGALDGAFRRAFCAVRPPGHHATGDTAMGFCLFNNVAVAAAQALERHGLARVGIVDFDVHHGNGTQAIFEREPRVLYLGSHQSPLYPGSGAASERGAGNIVNAPLPPGTSSAGFRAAWQQGLLPTLEDFAPQLLLVSAGFDGHWRDPLAQLRLQAGDYAWLTAALVAIADRRAQGRIVSMLEGGYDLDALRQCSVAHVGALLSLRRE